MSANIGIGILSCNRLPVLQKLLNSIRERVRTPIDLLIADDSAESNPCRGWLRNQPIPAVYNTPPKGVAGNSNVLLAALEGHDHIFLLNDDLEAKSDFVEFYIENLLKTGLHHVCLCSRRLVRESSWREHTKVFVYNGVKVLWRDIKPQGGLLLIDRKAFERVGYFDEKNFPKYGYEHVDYSNRIRLSGIQPTDGFYDFEGSANYIDYQTAKSCAGQAHHRQKNHNELRLRRFIRDTSRIRVELPRNKP